MWNFVFCFFPTQVCDGAGVPVQEGAEGGVRGVDPQVAGWKGSQEPSQGLSMLVM